MTAFPSIQQVNPEKQKINFRTLVTEFENGIEQTKQKRLYPTRDLFLLFRGLSIADARTLWQFYIARAGRFEAFSFFYPFLNQYVGEYVGTGDGSTTEFNLPSKTASGYTVYVDAAQQTETTNYTFTPQGGADGADLLTMVAAPAAGQYITYDFTGYLKVRSRFAEDYMEFETFYNRLVMTGLPLQGILNA